MPPIKKILKSRFGDAAIAPDSERYHELRRVYNGRYARRPEVIVRCASAEDVAAAIAIVRDAGCPLAVRGGGHSAAGFGVCERGVVLDLRDMKGIRLDPARRTLAAQAGLTWGELDAAAAEAGLATTGARISGAGVAGVTLGGGYGWLMRAHGLSIDNVISAEMVTADGRLVRASAKENSKLFWGVRGGGGNFGVATSFQFRLHPIAPLITGGALFYPAARARELLHVYRDFMATAGDDLSVLCNVLFAPPAPFVPAELRGSLLLAFAVCHLGPLEKAALDLAPLRALGPVLDRIRPMAYTKLQRMFDAAGEFGNLCHGRSAHLTALSDHAIETIASHAERITSPLSIVMISPLGGAVGRVGESDTAFGFRQSAFDLAINAVWRAPGESARHCEWVEAFWSAVRKSTHGVYVNELGDEGEDRVREAYTAEAFGRLTALKNVYDPENLFRRNQNIRPDASRQLRNRGEAATASPV